MADIEFNCPACKSSLFFDATHSGHISTCKKCGAPILVPTQNPQPKSTDTNIIAQSFHEKISQVSEYHKPIRSSVCPFCKATIVSNATFCLKCGRDLRSGKKLPPLHATAPKNNKIFPILLTLVLFLFFTVLLLANFTDIEAVKCLSFAKFSNPKSAACTVPNRESTDERLRESTDEVPTEASKISVEKLPSDRGKRYGDDPQETTRLPPKRQDRADGNKLDKKAITQNKAFTKEACPVCKGLGYRISGFNQRHIQCLNCHGDGWVTRVPSTALSN